MGQMGIKIKIVTPSGSITRTFHKGTTMKEIRRSVRALLGTRVRIIILQK